jgi:uncharacterized membrane protein YphA (DoxX/SURF4 family)
MKNAPENAGWKRLTDAVVGLKPWFPWPLSRWRWLNEPVPAERLALLRIGLAFFLLLDIGATYLPQARMLFGGDSLGRPEVFQWLYEPGWDWQKAGEDVVNFPGDLTEGKPFHRTVSMRWRWSLLHGVRDHRMIQGALLLWMVAAGCLLFGLFTRPAAVVVWLLSMSFANLNSYIDNAGDQVRYITTFYLMLTPCGAAWSLDAWLRRRFGRQSGPVFIYPWALRLLFVQLILIYTCNGLYKATGAEWQTGDSLYFVLGDLTLTRWSYAQVPVPYLVTQTLSWTVLIWEVGFPFWICLPWRGIADSLEYLGLSWPRFMLRLIRNIPTLALAFGFLFHLGIGISMELGYFVPYMLCLYLPLLPAERLSRWRRLLKELPPALRTETGS